MIRQKRTISPVVLLGRTRIPAAVAALFERFSLEVASAGHRRYSARGVTERIRWHTLVEKVGDFKVNNNWSAPLARWFLERHPELPDFFVTRQRQRDA